MHKLLLGLVASVLTLGTAAPAFADSALSTQEYTYYYNDTVPSWSADYIAFLSELGILEGYPDGTVRAAQNITRAEFAVALAKALTLTESRVIAAIESNNQEVYNDLVVLQTQLLSALARVDELEAVTLVENNNFVSLSVIYNAENKYVDDNAYISLDGKIQIVSISNTFRVSVRPFVNTTGEAGSALTLDTVLTDNLTVGIGMGYAGSWSDTSALAGNSNGVTYAQANVDYNLSKNTVITLNTKVPVEGENSGDVQFGLGFGISF